MRYAAMLAGVLLSVGCEADDPAPSVLNAADTVHMVVEWEVAPGVHPASDSLGDLSGVAVDLGGNVYASDRLAAKIWVFDPSGELLLGLGGKGEGPGELEAPTGPSVSPDGRLYVRDVYRVTVYGEAEPDGLLTTLEHTFEGPTYADWTSEQTTQFDQTGAMLYPGKRWLEDGTSHRYFLRYTQAGDFLDTLFVPTQPTSPQVTAFVRQGASGGRMLFGLNHVPFAAIAVSTATPEGTTISGDALTYELLEADAGGQVVRTFGRPVERDAIPGGLVRDSTAALRARLDSVPVPLDQVQGMPEEVRSVDLPETFPAYMSVQAGNDGTVWVRRWPVGGGGRTVFDVFTREGVYDHTVVLPRFIDVEPTPFLSADVVVGLTTHSLTGEHMILRFAPDGFD